MIYDKAIRYFSVLHCPYNSVNKIHLVLHTHTHCTAPIYPSIHPSNPPIHPTPSIHPSTHTPPQSINFQELAADLAEITFKFPFRIPPYFALVRERGSEREKVRVCERERRETEKVRVRDRERPLPHPALLRAGERGSRGADPLYPPLPPFPPAYTTSPVIASQVIRAISVPSPNVHTISPRRVYIPAGNPSHFGAFPQCSHHLTPPCIYTRR